MAAIPVAQVAKRVTLGGRERIEHPMRGLPETITPAVVLMHGGLLTHRHAAHILVLIIGAVPHAVGFNIGQVLTAVMLDDVRG